MFPERKHFVIIASAITVFLAAGIYVFVRSSVTRKSVQTTTSASIRAAHSFQSKAINAGDSRNPDDIGSSHIQTAKSSHGNSSNKIAKGVIISSHVQPNSTRQAGADSNKVKRYAQRGGSQGALAPDGQMPGSDQRVWNMFDGQNQYFFEKYAIDTDNRKLINDTLLQELRIKQQEIYEFHSNSLTMDERSQLIRDRSQRMQDALLDALGEEKLAQFIYYQGTLPQRDLANLVAAQSQNNGAPMSNENIDNLVDILDNHRVLFTRQELIMDSPKLQKNVSDSVKKNMDAVLQDAQGKLTPPQAEALQQVLNTVAHWQ